jgi:hypothetical protein
MKIGIIVYSLTGNALFVAERLRDRLEKDGHKAVIEQVKLTREENPRDPDFTIESYPDPSPYDAVIFGAQVRAFRLSLVMSAYLKAIPELKGKKAGCFVTKALPGNWTGGNGALAAMKSACIAKGGIVYAAGIVHLGKKRDRQTAELTEKFAKNL